MESLLYIYHTSVSKACQRNQQDVWENVGVRIFFSVNKYQTCHRILNIRCIQQSTLGKYIVLNFRRILANKNERYQQQSKNSTMTNKKMVSRFLKGG